MLHTYAICKYLLRSTTHLGIIEGTSLGAPVGLGVQGVLAKQAKLTGQALSELTNIY
jgi:hypothetical protein